MIEMNENLKKRLLKNDITNQDWQRIMKILNSNKDNIRFSFERIIEFIYRKELSDNILSSVLRKMCVSISIIERILSIIYNKKHFDFDRIYEQITCLQYIRDFTNYFKRFLKRCSKCNINRTRLHKSFDSLQSI